MLPALWRMGQKGAVFRGLKLSLLAVITYFDYRKNDSISKNKDVFYSPPPGSNFLIFRACDPKKRN